MKKIYRQAFGVENEFESKLFTLCGDYLKTLKINGKAVSILFSLPCTLKTERASIPAHYLFALATAEDERGKGYMTRLLNSVINNNEAFILRPSEESLAAYYEKFGFKKLSGNDSVNKKPLIAPQKEFKALAVGEESNDGRFILMGLNLPENTENIYFPFTMP